MRFPTLLTVSFLALPACGGSVPPTKGAETIRVERAAPPPGARAIRELVAVDGEGCGIFGTLGTYDGAAERLRTQARALGADYVHVTSVKEPAATRECVEKAFTLKGVAYAVRVPAPALAPASASAPTPPVDTAAAEPASRGLPLGATGCSLGPLAPGASRTLSFSARVPRGTRFGTWIDRAGTATTPEGIVLEYDPAVRRIALVRKPGVVAVSVGPEPFELDDAWHEWRVLRAADRISVWLDERLLLLYAAPAPSGDTGFLLEGEGVEVRRVLGSAP